MGCLPKIAKVMQKGHSGEVPGKIELWGTSAWWPCGCIG